MLKRVYWSWTNGEYIEWAIVREGHNKVAISTWNHGIFYILFRQGEVYKYFNVGWNWYEHFIKYGLEHNDHQSLTDYLKIGYGEIREKIISEPEAEDKNENIENEDNDTTDIEEDEIDRDTIYFQMAIRCLENKKYDDAVLYFIKSINEESAIDSYESLKKNYKCIYDDIFAFKYVGKIYTYIENKKSFLNAVKCFKHYIKNVSNDVEVFMDLGMCYEVLGLKQEAKNSYFKAIKLDSNKALVYAQETKLVGKLVGMSFYEMGKYYEAINIYKKSIQLYNNNIDGGVFLLIACAYLEVCEYEKALKYLKKTIRINPKHKLKRKINKYIKLCQKNIKK